MSSQSIPTLLTGLLVARIVGISEAANRSQQMIAQMIARAPQRFEDLISALRHGEIDLPEKIRLSRSGLRELWAFLFSLCLLLLAQDKEEQETPSPTGHLRRCPSHPRTIASPSLSQVRLPPSRAVFPSSCLVA